MVDSFVRYYALLNMQLFILSPVCYCNEAVQEMLDEGIRCFVQKPYHMQQLSEAVAKTLWKEIPS